MIEITQVNASLDEAGDENACLIVGKRVAKCVLRCKDSEIKSIELSLEARKRPSGIPDGPNAFLIIDCAATGCLQRECPRAMPTQG